MKYECKENDAIIELGKDKEEVLISINGEKVKTVIGLKDLNQALILFGVGKHRELLNSFLDYAITNNYIGLFNEFREELLDNYEKTI